MRPWPLRLLALAAAMFVAGWALVIAFGGNANAGGTSRIVWRVGGLMLYASALAFLAVGIWALFVTLRSAVRRRAVDRP